MRKMTKNTNFNEKMTKNSDLFAKITGKCLTNAQNEHIMVLYYEKSEDKNYEIK
jgi:hypothetical protein|tara:strand:+ start:310 stop:471 length:162 start_codon:yes stop_codon:yes gene_type:complete